MVGKLTEKEMHCVSGSENANVSVIGNARVSGRWSAQKAMYCVCCVCVCVVGAVYIN